LRLPSTRKARPATLILLPNNEIPNVLQKLQNLPAANPRTLGIKRHVPFSSGALLVTCGSEEQANHLRTISQEAGIQEKKLKNTTPEFRIHQIPAHTTLEELKEDIAKRFGEIEAEPLLLKYKNEKFKDLQFAVVKTTPEGLKQASQTRTIRVGWTVCKIDTQIYVKRCPNCSLLGHSEKHCSSMDASTSTEEEGCKDCIAYNKNQLAAASIPGVRKNTRPTTHSTGSKQCPTLLAFKKKSLPLRQPRKTKNA